MVGGSPRSGQSRFAMKRRRRRLDRCPGPLADWPGRTDPDRQVPVGPQRGLGHAPQPRLRRQGGVRQDHGRGRDPAMIEAFSEQLLTIDEPRGRMPHLPARQATGPVSRPSRQPATGLPGNYPDRTSTGRRRRASDQVTTARQSAPDALGARNFGLTAIKLPRSGNLARILPPITHT